MYLLIGANGRIKISGQLSTTFYNPNSIAIMSWNRLKTPSMESLFSSCLRISYRCRKRWRRDPFISSLLIQKQRCVCSVVVRDPIQLELLVVLDLISGIDHFIALGEDQVAWSAFPEKSTFNSYPHDPTSFPGYPQFIHRFCIPE